MDDGDVFWACISPQARVESTVRFRKDAMMRKLLALLTGVTMLTGFSGCQQTTLGSLSREAVDELLSADSLAVTPRSPGWLLEEEAIFKLSEKDAQRLRELLKGTEVNEVKEECYRRPETSAEEGAQHRFCLYASNAQCMEGRVAPGKLVMLDDLKLSAQQQQELYAILRPYLLKIYPSLP